MEEFKARLRCTIATGPLFLADIGRVKQYDYMQEDNRIAFNVELLKLGITGRYFH